MEIDVFGGLARRNLVCQRMRLRLALGIGGWGWDLDRMGWMDGTSTGMNGTGMYGMGMDGTGDEPHLHVSLQEATLPRDRIHGWMAHLHRRQCCTPCAPTTSSYESSTAVTSPANNGLGGFWKLDVACFDEAMGRGTRGREGAVGRGEGRGAGRVGFRAALRGWRPGREREGHDHGGGRRRR